jgi:hypothetical protein
LVKKEGTGDELEKRRRGDLVMVSKQSEYLSVATDVVTIRHPKLNLLN